MPALETVSFRDLFNDSLLNLTFFKFGKNLLFVLLVAWLTLWPLRGIFPVSAHFLEINNFVIYISAIVFSQVYNHLDPIISSIFLTPLEFSISYNSSEILFTIFGPW